MDPRQAPFREYSTRVRSSWIDYNGHMNDSAYAIVATEASEVFLDALDLSARYQAATGCTTYTVESHIYYLKEAVLDDLVTAETVLVDTDLKRLRVRHTLSTSAGPIATAELLYLHVNQQSGRVEPFPDSQQAVLAEVLAAHQT
jgi:betainyl-CoA thioesterase